MVSKTAENTTPTGLEENKYELMVIINPDMSDDDFNKELNDLRKQIKDLKGDIYHEDLWNIRKMAYNIKKHDEGYYAVLYFTADSLKVKDLDKSLFLNPKVLRHLIVKSPKGYVIKPLAELELTEEERKRPRTDKPGDSRGKYTLEKPVKKYASKSAEKTSEKPVKEVKAEEKEVEKPAKAKKEEKPMDISDLDSKLSSILDDSDLNMKL